jgi:hypothetical protein
VWVGLVNNGLIGLSTRSYDLNIDALYEGERFVL